MWNPFRRSTPQTLGLSTDTYEGMLVDAYERQATQGLRATALGAVEHAAGLVGRSLAAASVDGTDLLTPPVLRDIGHALIRHGESIHLFAIGGQRRQSLTRVVNVSVYGGHDPASWKYDLQLSGPTTTETRRYSAGQVVHVRYSTLPHTPWQGISPLRHAALTGSLATRLESSLGNEAGIPNKRLSRLPTGFPDDKVEGLKASLLSTGGFALLETTRQGGGLGAATAPLKDWDFDRLGPDYTAAEITLYQTVYATVLGICGVPPALSGLTGSTGGALLREAIRIFHSHTLDPLCRIIEAEVSRVLERDIEIKLSPSPEATRIRAQTIKVLKEAGFPLGEAQSLAGLG